MKIAIMQPYIFPYIGYFQLINAVDKFVIYDNIQFTKKGWINRNRLLLNGKDEYFTLPVKSDSDFLNVIERELSIDWLKEKTKVLNKIKENYKKAPYFNEVYNLVESNFNFENLNLFDFILNALKNTLNYLSIKTEIVISSTLAINHSLKAEEKVIAICKELNAETYLNPIGGIELYNKEHFLNEGIKLNFIKANNCVYNQLNNEFIPFLSIIDVMMFNSKEEIKRMIEKEYVLI
jgi:hypothetical protein